MPADSEDQSGQEHRPLQNGLKFIPGRDRVLGDDQPFLPVLQGQRTQAAVALFPEPQDLPVNRQYRP